MLKLTTENIKAIKNFISKRWPDKYVSTCDGPDAQEEERFIKISTKVKNTQIAHYEYLEGRFELHLEGEYYQDAFTYWLYKYLREKADTTTGVYRWHNWWGMRQGRLTYEQYIDNPFDIADAMSEMIPYIDGLIDEYVQTLEKNTDSGNDVTEAEAPKDIHSKIVLNQSTTLPQTKGMEVSELQVDLTYIKDLPFENFEIPHYQRPYKWNPKHINQLINDLVSFRDKKEYRLGTLVIHNNNIVDGQQRITTLSLLFYVIFEKIANTDQSHIPYKDFLDKIRIHWNRAEYTDPISIAHIRENLTCIRERRDELDEDMLTFLLEKCQFVVVRLPKISEAFQFFDSQNARGKDLEPHDLLKAFHLREIHGLNERDKQNISRWQDEDPKVLINLFLAMYRVNRWSKTYSGDKFTKDDVAVFKGISLNSKHHPTHLQQVICHYFINDYIENKVRMIDKNSLEYPFQLDQVCINGSRFFDMIRHYCLLFKQIRKSETYIQFGTHELSSFKVISFLNTYTNRHRQGDIYTRELFDCMLLYYIDRFGFEEINKVVWKLFKEAFRLRLEQYSVKLATIDNAAKNGRMFRIIRDAQTPFDVINTPTCQLTKIADNIDENKDELLKLFRQ